MDRLNRSHLYVVLPTTLLQGDTARQVQTEVELLQRCRHPNIVTFFGVADTVANPGVVNLAPLTPLRGQQQLYIVTELCACDLAQLLSQQRLTW